MNTSPLTRASALATSRWTKKLRMSALALALFCAAFPQNLSAFQDDQDSQQPAQTAQAPQGPAYTPQTADQLQQLVAPIALYPDSLVAQILAASTFPAQMVEADRWVQDHSDLKGDALAQAVDQQPWDPSVKALTAFPSVLANMDKNLSWTSSLGDAYYNQQQDVMNAIQVMRQKAEDSGNLKTTPQQTVEQQDSSIVIQPADPQVVYVPAYDPWLVYGYPLTPWPYWYPTPGIWFGGPYLSFGVGFGVGFYGGYGWGWNNWGADWRGRGVIYNNNRYTSRSTTFYNRNNYYRAGGEHGVANNVRAASPAGGGGYGRGGAGVYNGAGAAPKPFNGDSRAARGFSQPQGQQNYSRSENGMSSSALSGYDHGGESRSYSSRGAESFGGGGSGGGGGGGGGHHR